MVGPSSVLGARLRIESPPNENGPLICLPVPPLDWLCRLCMYVAAKNPSPAKTAAATRDPMTDPAIAPLDIPLCFGQLVWLGAILVVADDFAVVLVLVDPSIDGMVKAFWPLFPQQSVLLLPEHHRVVLYVPSSQGVNCRVLWSSNQ